MPDYTDQLNQEKSQDQKKIKVKKKTTKPISKITGAEFLIVLCLAASKDILDGVLLLIGIGLVLSRITNIIITGALWLWCLMRLHKFPTQRFIGSFLLEMVPVLGTISPTWTIFILTIYAEQRGHLPKWASKLARGKI
jgi:hypothetical protein